VEVTVAVVHTQFGEFPILGTLHKCRNVKGGWRDERKWGGGLRPRKGSCSPHSGEEPHTQSSEWQDHWCGPARTRVSPSRRTRRASRWSTPTLSALLIRSVYR